MPDLQRSLFSREMFISGAGDNILHFSISSLPCMTHKSLSPINGNRFTQHCSRLSIFKTARGAKSVSESLAPRLANLF